MKQILISAPGQYTKNIYLPYVWAILKTYAEEEPLIARSFRWLDPIFLYHGDAFRQLDQVIDEKIDILGLSAYVWNWSTNLEIAKRVKARNPDCLIVAGGPHPAWGEKGFIDRFELIDIIVKREGEEPFKQILLQYLQDIPDYTKVPNLILRNDIHTPETIGPLDLPTLNSPITAQGDALAKYCNIIRETGEHPHIIWETNRGCPYSCSFCDWGSATASKVRKFDIDRLKSEVDWFSSTKIHTVFIADSNYGMLKRDEQTAEWLANAKKTNGYPEFIILNPPKNKQDVAARITALFCEAGLFALSTINFQHTRKTVLNAIDRENISIDKLMEPLVKMWQPNTPLSAVVINGNPGDTPDLWKDCHDDMLEWGFHEDIVAVDFVVLPNAPAGAKAYRDKWKIRTISRRIPQNRLSKYNRGDRAENFCDYIISTSTFTEQQWIEMKLWTVVLQGLHNYGPTRFIAYYLRHYKNVRYRDFYETLIEGAQSDTVLGRVIARVRTAIEQYVRDPEAELFMDVDPSFSFYCQLDGGTFFLVMQEREQFYKELLETLETYFDISGERLRDLITFQSEILISPDYDATKGKDFELQYNWLEVFGEILRTKPTQDPPLLQIQRKPQTVKIRQTTSGHLGRTPLDFKNLEDYYLKIVRVGYMRNFTAYFRDSILDQEKVHSVPTDYHYEHISEM